MTPKQFDAKRPMHLSTRWPYPPEQPQRGPVRARQRCSLLVLLALLLSGCHHARPPDADLPVFIPSQLPPFDCAKSNGPSPPDDPQAKAWLDESVALRQQHRANVLVFERIDELREKAAKRHYWPAVRTHLGGCPTNKDSRRSSEPCWLRNLTRTS